MAKDDPHFRLRLPSDLKERIENAAGEHRRSINAEIVFRLEGSFDGEFSDRRSGELLEAIREIVLGHRIADALGTDTLDLLDDLCVLTGEESRERMIESILRERLKTGEPQVD